MAERPELPLFAWQALDLRDTRPLRRRRIAVRRRFVLAGLAIMIGSGFVIGAAIDPPLPRLVWNASASAPVGLYGVVPGARLKRGDMVIAWPPPTMRRLAADRHYLPAAVPLVKRVVAVAGDRVCASGSTIEIDGRTVVTRRARDGAGRPMPWWAGCVTLGTGSVFLVMTASSDSFDGRYFGPTDRRDVLGKAIPLWVR